MTSNGLITEALLLIYSCSHLRDCWWTDEAIMQLINIIESLNFTHKQLNIAVTKDQDAFSDVDTLEGLTSTGEICIRRKVNGVVKFFYFLKKNGTAQTPRKQDERNKIINKHLPQLLPRRTISTPSPAERLWLSIQRM